MKRTVDEWREALRDREVNGLTRSQWCQKYHATRNQYQYWKNKIHDIDTSQSEEDRAARNSEHTEFVEITVVPGTPVQGAPIGSAVRKAPALEPELILNYEDYSLLIGNNISEDTLQKVLRAMRNA